MSDPTMISPDMRRYLLEVLKDVRLELDEPQVAELTTLALDRKVDDAIELLEKSLGTND